MDRGGLLLLKIECGGGLEIDTRLNRRSTTSFVQGLTCVEYLIDETEACHEVGPRQPMRLSLPVSFWTVMRKLRSFHLRHLLHAAYRLKI